MNKIIDENDQIYIQYAEDSKVLFPKIDFNKIKFELLVYNKKKVLETKQNLTFDEIINYFKVSLIRQLKNKRD